MERIGSTLDIIAVTPSDTTVYDPPLRGIYIGSEGDVAIVSENGVAPVIFKNVPVAMILPVKARQVMSTGTDASELVGLY